MINKIFTIRGRGGGIANLILKILLFPLAIILEITHHPALLLYLIGENYYE